MKRQNGKIRIYTVVLLAALLAALSGCGKNPAGTPSEFHGESGREEYPVPGGTDILPESSRTEEGNPGETDRPDPESSREPAPEPSGTFTVRGTHGNDILPDGSVYRIRAEGKYTLSGVLSDGRIEIEADDEKVELVLSGVRISSGSGAPVSCISGDRLTLTLEEGTSNVLEDLRPAPSDDTAEDVKGALYAKADLVIHGEGALEIRTSCYNGIHTTKDLRIEDAELSVTAPHHAVKANDSAEIRSGNLTLISSGGDGIKTENTDLSKKGQQRGNVVLSGGRIEIFAARDGIDAACDVEIGGEGTRVLIRTGSCSPYTGDSSGEKERHYLIVTPEVYGEYEHFGAVFSSESGKTELAEGRFGMHCYGGRNQYEAIEIRFPSWADTVTYAAWNGDLAPEPGNSENLQETLLSEGCIASSSERIRDELNAWLLTSLKKGRMEGDGVMLDTGGSGNEVSVKGIKAGSGILISDGEVDIESDDDAIHANAGTLLESGSYGEGRIEVSGGVLNVKSGDDGLHADGELLFSGGDLSVLKSHEGLEANVIRISGGNLLVYSDDDGLNACSGTEETLISVSGGNVRVITPRGDTDGIDANGNYVQTGGFVVVDGGATMGGMAGSVDTDGEVSVTGGTIIALGGICETPGGDGDVCLYASQRQEFMPGLYELKDGDGEALCSFEVENETAGCWFASSSFSVGGSYVLYREGKEVLRWEQESRVQAEGGELGPFSPGNPYGPGPGKRPGGGNLPGGRP